MSKTLTSTKSGTKPRVKGSSLTPPSSRRHAPSVGRKGETSAEGGVVDGMSTGKFGISPQSLSDDEAKLQSKVKAKTLRLDEAKLQSKVKTLGFDEARLLSKVVKAKTLRLTPEFEAGLSLLKNVLGKPVNKMVNEAVGEYIQRRAAEVEIDLTGVLEQIKAYRRSDPTFARYGAAFIDAELKYGAEDPVEGVIVDVEPPAKAKGKKSKVGPAQTMVRELLRG